MISNGKQTKIGSNFCEIWAWGRISPPHCGGARNQTIFDDFGPLQDGGGSAPPNIRDIREISIWGGQQKTLRFQLFPQNDPAAEGGREILGGLAPPNEKWIDNTGSKP